MKIKVAPSILSADFSAMGEAVEKLEKAGADMVHCDVMDGIFVPNITFGPKMVADIKKCTRLPLDVHLMIDRPERYLDEFVKAGADYITVHYEATRDAAATLRSIREKGVKSGLVLNPDTDADVAAALLPYCDMLLIMSVYPGFGGQKYIPASTEKIRKARKLIDESGYGILLEADGGITPDNAGEVIRAGTDVIVAGSAVFGAADMKAAVSALKVAGQA